MSDSGRRKPPLVADKRSRAQPPAKAAKPASAKSASRSGRKTPARKKSGHRNPVVRFVVGIFSWIWRLVWGFSWRVGLVAGLILLGAVGYFYTTLPDVNTLLDGRQRGSVTLLDADGKVFAWRGDQFGGVVSADAISPHLKNAVIATEDKRFYRHLGVSPRGIAGAIRINVSEGRSPLSGNGGSTITQQTAKLLCLGVPYDPQVWKTEQEYEADCRRGSLSRKIKEAVYAFALEAKYTKDEILSVYINRAYLGGGAFGAEAASQRYFGKTSGQVSPAEAAMLAGLLTAPTSLAPTNNLERSQNRAAVVIRLMREQGYLTQEEASNALANPARLSEAAEARAGGFFADWVMSSGPEFFTRNTTEDVVIRSTLDPRIQKAAEEAMQFIFENKVREGSKAQAAIVVMSADGAVRAMVGGRDTRVVGAFNRATQARRQTGSAFKPFVYAAALDLGYSPNDIVDDSPYCVNIAGSGEWCPNNYDRSFSGQVTLTEALSRSLNVPAVKVAQSVGLELVRNVAAQFGIQSDLAAGPALALGASEATLIETTGAFAGILNGGSAVTPYGLIELRMRDDDEPLMTATGGMGERVIRQEAAEQLTWMLHQVTTRGTGTRANLKDREVAGKTGTTQAARDAWFVGYSADYVAGVWMGYDDNTPLTGVTGSGLPSEIWHEVMVRVHDGLPARPLPMQAPVTQAPVQQPNSGQAQGQSGGRTAQPETQNAIEQLFRDLFGSRRN
ncbi:MAG: transglycosylase domain-containing protein [Paracoccaceae bacterium]|uniref:transglycosylase domain-containing protein n=1 Tax=Seohaeicola saemankumensis TaxID=481181 RepID=UPI001E2A1DE0|nr:PBP1A family penicillin-binding protein [Seohaeicola saemankumensis]MCD1624780.1 PBP1A family penicillin-binding protein [Seohaeicola saemankumensis]